jgi:serine/threonine protein kinase
LPVHCPACGRAVPVGTSPRFCGECGTPLPAGSDSETVAGPPVPQGTIKPRADTPSAGRFLPGAVIAERYRMVALLGRGGMGEVYRADDLKVGQAVALKFLPVAVARDPERLDHFLTEVRMSLRVTHPNVCRVFDVGQIDQRHFLSMEYVDGEDLASLLRRIGRLPEDKAVEIARQLCAGLAAAHDEGVLHRDLKPANIMIDGRGRAKITDFGLAGATEGISGRDAKAGTPQYMAPEQVAGGTLTERTDLYALGLVLYELFTGKRAFEIKSLDDVDKLVTSTPTSPSSHVSGLNALVERAILRCLDPDPAKRPSSANALAASLPGGDPLAMAIAAGDTPSPEMVAAAGSDTGLRRPTALLLLGASLAGMALISFLTGLISFNSVAAPTKAPEVLIERSREFLQSVGFPPSIQDSAWGFENTLYFNWTTAERARDSIDQQAANAVWFWYREAQIKIERRNFVNPFLLNTIWPFDPPLQYSGEVLVRLDREGRLRSLTAIPAQRPASAPKPTDWAPLFRAAGLDIASWRPDAPEWTPQFYGDERVAWVPHAPRDDRILRVEAASFHGRPVHFVTVFPWSAAWRDAGTSRTDAQRFADLSAILVLSGVMVAAVLVARRNLRLDRADRKGATRLAVIVMGLTAVMALLDEHHVPSIWQMYLVMMDLGWVLFASALIAAFYLALEPHVRRAWPGTIISWSRAIGGAWNDPLVARDVLIGLAVGGLNYTVSLLGEFTVLRATGLLPNLGLTPAPLMGARHAVAALASAVVWSLYIALSSLFALIGLRKLLRREWAAIAVGSLLFGVLGSLFTAAPGISLPFQAIVNAIAFLMLARVGLVASIASLFVANALPMFPVVWPPDQWYSGIGFLGLAVTTAIAIAAFRAATRSGRPRESV